ncbi:ring hydroxylating alpha subunit family protein [Delftia acidovorans]|uniref:aromatic ring-hydroxylating oxygenase subunit alpha n=1 Tax=Delftia acidovorans TaxID=80866 RepID=UPI000508AC6B|nr:aromatic ring-hydroxylating dioxygenase subunit alpha [Delftia acidovorans]KFJ13611.1 ring hydroxylating alpha subunit family protein [Delftia acidovorans]QQB49749.1 aromatic ring-hydroxylating dioxygenase subunit alpha [Delftia acidovorans]
MRSRMHPKYYLSQEIFEREQQKIFRKVWLFAGLVSLLPKNHSFITRKIAGIPVVIQNFNGELRAFENICLHRSAPLQQGFTGTRPLVCAYHAWSYDSQGQVKNIPDCDAIYRLDACERKSLKLREFSLRQIGGLLFINLSSDPMKFEEQFSAQFIELLQSSAESYDSEVMMTTWHAKFNWKLVYENLRDVNHVKYLHAKSLAKVASFPFSAKDGASMEKMELDCSPIGLRKDMRTFSHGGAEGAIEPIRWVPWLDKVERWGDTNAYFNWLTYPNLHIASGNGGYSFTIEHHVPVSPGETDVEIFFIAARKKVSYADSAQVLLSQMHYSKQVVGEDIAILEAVQAVLHEKAPLPTQGAYEYANRHIERWYTTLMETDHEI